jgi:hypothetical protein
VRLTPAADHSLAAVASCSHGLTHFASCVRQAIKKAGFEVVE